MPSYPTLTWTRYLGFLSVAFLLCLPGTLMSQAAPAQQLKTASTLEEEGHPEQAVEILQPLLNAHSMDGSDAGKAWAILALSYEDLADFPHAQRAYEESIRTLENIPNDTRDYAMVLSGLGGLYLDTGQFDLAIKLRERSLHLFESISDHAGTARTLCDMAATAFSQNDPRQGSRYLKQAWKEAQRSNNLNEDDRASMASMQGWKAQFDGNPLESISKYQQALSLWRKRHGEEHPFTGWGYMLVGRAQAEAGESKAALADMRQGLSILEHTLSANNPRYLTAEIAYAEVLEQSGARTEAAQIKVKAEELLHAFYSSQCTDCTVSALAFH